MDVEVVLVLDIVASELAKAATPESADFDLYMLPENKVGMTNWASSHVTMSLIPIFHSRVPKATSVNKTGAMMNSHSLRTSRKDGS